MEWTVSFKEYLNFGEVKSKVKKVKQSKREQKGLIGFKLERNVVDILNSSETFEVKPQPPQVDIAFGADVLVSYKKNDKNYSFYLDITGNTKHKYTANYLNMRGEVVEDSSSAFTYQTETLKINFGVKYHHAGMFNYEKPVMVLLVSDYNPDIDNTVSSAHITNITNILISLNEFLIENGYGARASQLVRPNAKRFPNEYTLTKN